jgi:hypothetical protein
MAIGPNSTYNLFFWNAVIILYTSHGLAVGNTEWQDADSVDTPCTIEVRDVSNITLSEFRASYAMKKPLLIRGGARKWPALKRWTKSYMMKKFGGARIIPKQNANAPSDSGSPVGVQAQQEDLREFLESMNDNHQLSDDDISWDWSLESKLCNVKKTGRQNRSFYVMQGWDRFMSHADCDASINRKLLKLMKGMSGEQLALEEYLMVGPNGTGLYFHTHGSALNAAIHGRRRWWVFSGSSKELVNGRNLDLWKEVDSLKDGGVKVWAENFYPVLPEAYKREILECVQEKGDIMYVPAGAEHAVLNYGDAVAVSWNIFDMFAEGATYGVDLTPGATLPASHDIRTSYNRLKPRDARQLGEL